MVTNRQDRRFARREPPEGLRPWMGAMNVQGRIYSES